MGQSSQPHELGGGLKSRHVTMLSIAGVIGASLLSVPASPSPSGPGGITGYLFAGLLVGYDYADVGGNGGCHADTGSFSTYADRPLAAGRAIPSAGLCWWFWVLVIPLEANIRRHDPTHGLGDSHLVIFLVITSP